MKTMLLILIVLAGVAMADEPKSTPTQAARMSDAQMTSLIVGAWEDNCTFGTIEYKSDGTYVFKLDEKDVVEKWYVKDGALLKTDSEMGTTNYFKILFLTEDEWLTLGMSKHTKGYTFLKRKYLDY
jgi:hypothetical protein